MKKNLKVIDMILAPSDRKIDYLNCLRRAFLCLLLPRSTSPPPQQPSDRQQLLHYLVWSFAEVGLVTAQVPEKGRVPGAPSLLGTIPYSLRDTAVL